MSDDHGRPSFGGSSSLLDAIGNTPLLRLTRITQELPQRVEVYVKAEWFNPGGSVKDRPGRQIVLDAESDRRLGPDRTVLDSSFGNAGIGHAIIGAARGYRVPLVVPGHGIEGLKHMGSAIVPGIYDPSVHQRKISVRTETAYALAKRLAREEGLLVGQSSGAAVAGALEVARDQEEGVIVVVCPDGGDRYLSTALWR